MTFDVGIGESVLTSDGKDIGKVDGLVVDPDSMDMLEIIVHKGFLFSTDRIIDVVYIDRVDDDGTIHLNVDASRANDFPPYVTHEYVVATGTDRGAMPVGVGIGPTVNQPIMWRARPVGRGMHVTGEAGYLAAVAQAVPVEVRSDLPTAAVVIDAGTDVIAADGQKIGTVDDILYNDEDELTGFIVEAGFFHHRDIPVPISNVAAITSRYVRLNVDAVTIKGK